MTYLVEMFDRPVGTITFEGSEDEVQHAHGVRVQLKQVPAVMKLWRSYHKILEETGEYLFDDVVVQEMCGVIRICFREIAT